MQEPQTDRITLVCTAHKGSKTGTATIHDSAWAYCPGGKPGDDDGHLWTAVQPATLDEVRLGHVALASPVVPPLRGPEVSEAT